MLGIAGVHVAWGRGSAFPFATVEEMHDAVIGRPVSPSPASCYAIAGLLTVAAATCFFHGFPQYRCLAEALRSRRLVEPAPASSMTGALKHTAIRSPASMMTRACQAGLRHSTPAG